MAAQSREPEGADIISARGFTRSIFCRWAVRFVCRRWQWPEGNFVTSLPTPRMRSQISAAGGSKPRWSADGRHIFYLSPDLRLMDVPVRIEGTEIRSGPPAPLFQTSFDYHDERVPYAANRDGTAFLVAPYPRQQLASLSVITNWNGLSIQSK
jgi:hypothetical protein